MSLVPEEQDISFSGGLEQKIAERLLPAGMFATFKNAYQKKTGELAKRPGHSVLSQSIHGGGTIAACKKIAVFGDELCLFDGSKMYSYDKAANKWIDKGDHTPMRTTEKVVYKSDDYDNTMFSCHVTGAKAGNYYVWVLNKKYWVQDALTGAFIQSGVTIGTYTSNYYYFTRAVNQGDSVCLIWAEGSRVIKCLRLDVVADPTDTGTVSTLASDGSNDDTETPFDAIKCDNDHFLLAYHFDDGAADRRVRASMWSTTAAGAPVIMNAAINVESVYTQNIALSSVTSPDYEKHFFVQYDNNTEQRYSVLLYTGGALTVAAGPRVIGTFGISACVGSPINSTQAVFVLERYISADVRRLCFYTLTNDGSAASSIGTRELLGIAGRGYYYNGKAYFPVLYDSPTGYSTQNTAFLIDSDLNVISRYTVGTAGTINYYDAGNTHRRNIYWSDVIEGDSGEVEIAGASASHYWTGVSGGSAPEQRPLYGINKVTHDFNTCGNALTIGNNLLSFDGQVWCYDGVQLVEHGFHWYPQLITSVQNVGGGQLSVGVYSWRFVFVWWDSKGQKHRSAPSDPHTPATAAAGDYFTVTYYGTISNKTDLVVEAYRTEANGTIFYLEATLTVATDGSALSINLGQQISDAEIVENPVLYTQGGELDHISPPAPVFGKLHDNRVFVVTGDNRIHFTKQRADDFGVEFNDLLTITTDPKGGRIAALESQDGQLIIFKEDLVCRLFGEGPNPKDQGAYTGPISLSSDVGAEFDTETLLTSMGTFFKSDKGVWLIGRDFNPQYVGSSIENYNANAFLGGVVLQDKNEFRLILSGASEMIYFDTHHNRWGQITNADYGTAAKRPIGVVVWQDQFIYVDSNGLVYLQDDSIYTDNTQDIEMTIKTGKLALNGLVGYARLYGIRLLGEFKSAHTLTVTVYHDDGTSETFSYTITSSNEPYIIDIEPSNQKSRSVQIEISDGSLSGTKESVVLTGMRLKYGRKKKVLTKRSKSVNL